MKMGLLVVLLCGIIVYLTALYRHKKNQLFIAQQLQEKKFRAALLEHKVNVQEMTFKSVGIELHDNVGQLISTALMLLNVTERQFTNVPATLQTANATLNKCLNELRSLSKSLDEDWLKQFDLMKNIRLELNRVSSNGNLVVQFFPLVQPFSLSAAAQFMVFRVLQEGIQNVVRHSKANLLTITLKHSATHLFVTLKDDGVGFDVHKKTTGVGIQNIKQRVQLMGGFVMWESDGFGTALNLSIPLQNQTHAL